MRRRFGLELADEERPGTNLLGDWYANLLNVERSRWVLCLSERSLLPVLVPARLAEFPIAFPTLLREVLVGIGIPNGVADEEVQLSTAWQFARTRNRQVLGSMNDFAFHFQIRLRKGDDPVTAAIKLADMPCSPLELGWPNRTTFALLGVAGKPTSRW